MVQKQLSITKSTIQHVAHLSHLSLSDAQIEKFQPQLAHILTYVSSLQSLSTVGIPETAQVTGLTNVFREDVIEQDRCFSQEEALQNAPWSHQGYIAVSSIFDEEDNAA